ncbi:hypothetical protein SAMN04487831_103183 [Pseudobutyrivibrio sp. UC1225]|nr:hypothetical protein SAMN04487831_103183 [Pseudobutyrivibrio sp. UC1225]
MHIVCGLWFFFDDFFCKDIRRYSNYGEGLLQKCGCYHCITDSLS